MCTVMCLSLGPALGSTDYPDTGVTTGNPGATVVRCGRISVACLKTRICPSTVNDHAPLLDGSRRTDTNKSKATSPVHRPTNLENSEVAHVEQDSIVPSRTCCFPQLREVRVRRGG